MNTDQHRTGRDKQERQKARRPPGLPRLCARRSLGAAVCKVAAGICGIVVTSGNLGGGLIFYCECAENYADCASNRIHGQLSGGHFAICADGMRVMH